MPRLSVRLAASLLLGAAFTPATVAQSLPAAGVFFDDFQYRNALLPLGGIADRPTGENALFGVNAWCLDLACQRTASARAWYWYHAFESYFQRVDPLSDLEATTAGTGALDFVLRAGDHRLEGTHDRQVASGFAGTTGVWAAEATFSDLPNGLPDALRPADATAGRAPMIQAFWLISPFKVVRTPRTEWPTAAPRFATTEIDFEFNNWFYDSGRSRFLSTGYYENDDDVDRDGAPFTRARLGTPAQTPYACRVTTIDARGQARPPVVRSPDACASILAGADPVAGPRVPTLMIVRREPSRVRFEVRASWGSAGGRGTLSMETPWFDGDSQPSQLTTLMLSTSLRAVDDRTVVPVADEQRMRVDWVYHTPDIRRTADEVVADVALIRRRRAPDGRPAVARLFTIPSRDPVRALARPYRVATAADHAPAGEPLVALDPVTVTLEGPRTASLASRPHYLARLGRLAGDYLVEWRYASVGRDGRAGTPTPYDHTPGFRWQPAFAFRGAPPPCVRVDVRATRTQYHSSAEGVWWTPLPDPRERAKASVVTCRPGVRRPAGSG